MTAENIHLDGRAGEGQRHPGCASASLTPINDSQRKQSLVRPFGKIISINNWLKEYAAASGSIFR
jgi:hypothetical protein